jgi:hypothetical protein
MKRTALARAALALTFALLFSAVAGFLLVDLTPSSVAYGETYSDITVQSPEYGSTVRSNVSVDFTFEMNFTRIWIPTGVWRGPQDFALNKPRGALGIFVTAGCVLDGGRARAMAILSRVDNKTFFGHVTLTGLAEGFHKITLWAVAYQNMISYDEPFWWAASSMVQFTVDSTPPSVRVLSPLNATYRATELPLNFTVDEPLGWMGYSLDRHANVTVTSNTTLTNLSKGYHTLKVYANDTAGNMGASEMIYFSIALPSEPSPSEPFLTTWIVTAAVVIIVVAVATAAVYLIRKRKK